MFSLIIYAILVIVSIAAWINTKIILEEIDLIKKHLGIQEEKSELLDFQTTKEKVDDDDK